MAPVRRYLRISKYSVLECRIYLDNPSLTESWFLNPRNNILPRVIDSIMPLVIPKLREEFERSKGKGSKKRIKDIITEDDFEVAMFLTNTSSRHFVLTKQRNFFDPSKNGMMSNSNKLLGTTCGASINVEESEEEDGTDSTFLQRIPTADEAISKNSEHPTDVTEVSRQDLKRSREVTPSGLSIEVERNSKRAKGQESFHSDDDIEINEKKSIFTTYDGFFIHGRALCLIIKHLDKSGKSSTESMGRGKMEDWIISTQKPADE